MNDTSIVRLDDWLKQYQGKVMVCTLTNEVGRVESAILTGRENLVMRVTLRRNDGADFSAILDSLRNPTAGEFAEFEA